MELKPELVYRELERNRSIFKALLSDVPAHWHTWKPQKDKWCLLEIVCHLRDEEREDFRARTRQALEAPKDPLPSIDPVGWVTKRNYMGQNYHQVLDEFLEERAASVSWLRSLSSAPWHHAITHPSLGKISAGRFLYNWLAHDYLHIRQINRTNYQYLTTFSQENLAYAGPW